MSKWPMKKNLPDPQRQPTMAPMSREPKWYGAGYTCPRETWQLRAWREAMGDPERLPTPVSGPLMPPGEVAALMMATGRRTPPDVALRTFRVPAPPKDDAEAVA